VGLPNGQPARLHELPAAQVAQSTYFVLGTLALEVLGELLPPGVPCALVDFPNHANVGDSAIWLGERALLRRMGVPVVYTCDLNSFCEQDLHDRLPIGTILIHGGGNLGDLWPHHQDFRVRIIRAFPHHRIIQLPQSIHFRQRANLDRARSVFGSHRDLTICVRDHQSLDVARTQFAAPCVLCPDMAFGIEDLPKAMVAADYDIIWHARADHESAGQALPPLDDTVLVTDWAAGQGATPDWTRAMRSATQVYERSGANPDTRTAASDSLAELHVARGCQLLARSRAVVSDRLHGHLLSLLLGLPHVILADRHGKIASAFATWTPDCPAARWARTPAEALAFARELVDGGTVSIARKGTR
jgi:exopolysaccharide biosynthesis predicted pyruvyltransferase EpsI